MLQYINSLSLSLHGGAQHLVCAPLLVAAARVTRRTLLLFFPALFCMINQGRSPGTQSRSKVRLIRTEIVTAGLEFRNVDVTSSFGQLGHQIVAGWQLGLRKDSRDDLTSRIGPSADSARVQPLLGANDPVASNSLERMR